MAPHARTRTRGSRYEVVDLLAALRDTFVERVTARLNCEICGVAATEENGVVVWRTSPKGGPFAGRCDVCIGRPVGVPAVG